MSIRSCTRRRSSGKWAPPAMDTQKLMQLEDDVMTGFVKLSRRSIERKQETSVPCNTCTAHTVPKTEPQRVTRYIASHMQRFLDLSVRGLVMPDFKSTD